MTNSLFVDKKTKKSIFKTRSHSQLYSFISENVNDTLGENSFKLGDTTIGDKRLELWRKIMLSYQILSILLIIIHFTYIIHILITTIMIYKNYEKYFS